MFKGSLPMVIFSGIIAALFSYICNKWVLNKLEDIGVIAVVPFIEEAAKTGSSIIIGTSIIGTHFVFGIIEGIYDIVTSSKRIGKWAALASIISHSIFGFVTYLTINTGYSIYWGILLAWLIHSSWNFYIIKYL